MFWAWCLPGADVRVSAAEGQEEGAKEDGHKAALNSLLTSVHDSPYSAHNHSAAGAHEPEKKRENIMATITFTFTFKGSEFRASWLNDEHTRLSVRTSDTVLDENGLDQTEWPDDKIVSQAVGEAVEFHDAGDHPDESEAIFAAAGV